MTPLDKLTDAVAVTYASGVAGITDRQPDAPVDVCRFHREGAVDFVAAIQAALPEGCYLGREGVVRAERVNFIRDHWGGLIAARSAGNGDSLFAITPVEADQ